jgi:hypothetical protein
MAVEPMKLWQSALEEQAGDPSAKATFGATTVTAVTKAKAAPTIRIVNPAVNPREKLCFCLTKAIKERNINFQYIMIFIGL